MNCSVCSIECNFLCLCTNLPFCSEHLQLHLEKSSNHHYEELELLQDEESRKFDSELIIRLKSIKKARAKLYQETKNAVHLLETCAMQSLKKLDNHTKYILGFIKKRQVTIEEKQELKNILNNFIRVRVSKIGIDKIIKSAFERIFIYSSNFVDMPIEKKRIYFSRHLSANFDDSNVISVSNNGKYVFECKI